MQVNTEFLVNRNQTFLINCVEILVSAKIQYVQIESKDLTKVTSSQILSWLFLEMKGWHQLTQLLNKQNSYTNRRIFAANAQRHICASARHKNCAICVTHDSVTYFDLVSSNSSSPNLIDNLIVNLYSRTNIEKRLCSMLQNLKCSQYLSDKRQRSVNKP